MSSGGACQAALASGAFGRRIRYVGPERDLHMLSDIGLEPAAAGTAEAVLVTGLRDDRTETPEHYAGEIAGWAARGLPLLCANPDIVVDRGEERLWCAGAIARDYEAAGGRVVWYGKPHRPIYERCFEVLEQLAGGAVPPGRVLAAGDGIATDVEGGIRDGRAGGGRARPGSRAPGAGAAGGVPLGKRGRPALCDRAPALGRRWTRESAARPICSASVGRE
jgi:ribonucleotide monophosphatase NagD (HAD superfamily)